MSASPVGAQRHHCPVRPSLRSVSAHVNTEGRSHKTGDGTDTDAPTPESGETPGGTPENGPPAASSVPQGISCRVPHTVTSQRDLHEAVSPPSCVGLYLVTRLSFPEHLLRPVRCALLASLQHLVSLCSIATL